MKWTGLNEIREKYLSFFESKNHTRLASAPLIPQGDNSLLLINSGMAPLKKFFLGTETPPNVRVTTCQKCIRTPDIERVGITARHGTYFEMLGNFSFGDYFKEKAIEWAWEFLTGVLEIPADRLWITIFENDALGGGRANVYTHCINIHIPYCCPLFLIYIIQKLGLTWCYCYRLIFHPLFKYSHFVGVFRPLKGCIPRLPYSFWVFNNTWMF